MEFQSQTPLTNVSTNSSQSQSRMDNFDMEQDLGMTKEMEMQEALRQVLVQLDGLQIDKIVQEEVGKVVDSNSFNNDNISAILDEQVADFNTIHKLIKANDDILHDWHDRIQELRRRVKRLQILRPVSQRMWRVPNFSLHYENARNNSVTMLNSPYLFSHEYGYKIGLTLLPYGDGKTRGKYLALFFCIVQGQFDKLQAWPFAAPLKFTLMDHHPDPEMRKNIIKEFQPNPDPANEVFLGLPTQQRNPSLGFPKFITLDELYHPQRHYIDDDSIQIKVEIDISSIVRM